MRVIIPLSCNLDFFLSHLVSIFYETEETLNHGQQQHLLPILMRNYKQLSMAESVPVTADNPNCIDWETVFSHWDQMLYRSQTQFNFLNSSFLKFKEFLKVGIFCSYLPMGKFQIWGIETLAKTRGQKMMDNDRHGAFAARRILQ